MREGVASDTFTPSFSDPQTDADVTACFSVQTIADPSVIPRVLALFAKRGMVHVTSVLVSEKCYA